MDTAKGDSMAINVNVVDTMYNCPANHDRHIIKWYPSDGVCLDHLDKGKIVNWVKWDNFGVNEIDFAKYPMWLNIYPDYKEGSITEPKISLLPVKLSQTKQEAFIKKADVGFYARLGQPYLSKFFAYDIEGEPGHRAKVVDINMMALYGKYTFESSYLHPDNGAPGYMDNVRAKVLGDVIFASNSDVTNLSIPNANYILTAYEPSTKQVYAEITRLSDFRTWHVMVDKINYEGMGFTNFYPKAVEEDWKEGQRPYGGRLIGWGKVSYNGNNTLDVTFGSFPSSTTVSLDISQPLSQPVPPGLLLRGTLRDTQLNAEITLPF